MVEDFLDEETRAEDILLGSVGIDGDAKIVNVELRGMGYRGIARWPDGEVAEFESEDELNELEAWAIEILRDRQQLGH
ncbi:MAG: hypothetical protein GX589_11075 [Deltaproteobacteria bacterium]|nr:hypothetical protein [Deltaproteobacteria bacterium]